MPLPALSSASAAPGEVAAGAGEGERKALSLPGGEGSKNLELTAGAGSVFGKDELLLKDYVDIHYGDLRLQADSVRYLPATKDCYAEGNVILDSGSTRITARRVEYNLDTEMGTFYDARGYAEPSFYFEASQVQKIEEDRYLIVDARFTTCTQPIPYWSFKVARGTIHLDNYAYLHHVSFRVEKMPIFYSPYLVWPIKADRATGLLFPEFGFSRSRGFVISNAFYWAMRRNMDATFFLDYYALAGVGEGLEYRYVPSAHGKGEFLGAFIRDQVTDRDRYFYNLNHRQDLPGDFRLVASLNQLSDFDYFLDFQRDLRMSTSPVVLSDIYLTRNWGTYSANFRAERRRQIFNVTRQFFATTTTPALSRTEEEELTNQILPRMQFRGNKQRLGHSPLYFSFDTSLDSFDKQTTFLSTTYQRFDLNPTLSAPLRLAPWLDLNPSIGLRDTYYTKRLQLDARGLPAFRTEDRDGDGFPDRSEDVGLDGIAGTGDPGEGNGVLDKEDANDNGVLDPGEDLNGNGNLDTEDRDGDRRLDYDEDQGLDSLAGTGDSGELNGALDREQVIDDHDFLRKVLRGSVEIIGPKFSRIFERPESTFSPLYKNTIEPRIVYSYQSKVDNTGEIIQFDEKDALAGSQNSLQYGLVTRLFAKRPGVTPRTAPSSEGLTFPQHHTPPPGEGQDLSAPTDAKAPEAASLSPVEIASFEIFQVYDRLYPLSFWTVCRSISGIAICKREDSNLSPLRARFRFNPTLYASLDLRTEYHIFYNAIQSAALSANFRSQERGFVDVTWSYNAALDPSIAGFESFSTDSSQIGLLGETLLMNRKLVLGFQGNYDVIQRNLQEQRYKIGYNTQCCGFTFEFLDRGYQGVSQQEFRMVVNLKGIGNVLDLNSGTAAIPTNPLNY